MNRKRTQLLLFIVAVMALSGCYYSLSPVRYGNRAFCGGFFSEPPGDQLINEFEFGFPAQIPLVGMWTIEGSNGGTFALLDRSTVLHIIDRSGALISQEDYSIPFRSIEGAALSDQLELLALSYRPGGYIESSTTRVFSLGSSVGDKQKQPAVLQGLKASALHPFRPFIAGFYHKDSDDIVSSDVAIFDLEHSDSEPVSVYKLPYAGRVLGWSSNGEIIAVDQYDKNGLVPTYIRSKSGEVVNSLYNTSAFNCIGGAQWSPGDQRMVFNGRNEASLGWDIFLEEIAPSSETQSSLTNLTNSPEEDEIAASWSPDGAKLVYAKAFLGTDGTAHQELYLIDLSQPMLKSTHLTDTPYELETNPMWVSGDEIAYFSWDLSDSTWYLKILSITEPDQEPETIITIPESWYRAP